MRLISVLAIIIASTAQAADQSALRALLPKIASTEVTEKINSDSVLFYTDDDFPKCYQITGENGDLLPGVHSVFYNIAGDADFKRLGNGNREFPWGDPAGTQWTKNLYAFRFLYLPPRDEGGVWPVVYFNRVGVEWIFPVGAMLGEVLCLYDPRGNAWPFEVRVRVRDASRWDVDVYRPFDSAANLAKAVGELPASSQRDRLLRQLAVPDKVLPVSRVRADHPRNNPFDATARIDSLTPLPEADVGKLLSRPFVSVLGAKWRDGANAPSTKADFHIVPREYAMAFVPVDSDSCMDCHKHTMKHVDTFDPGRDWYGHVRGSDGIFSFHPFDRFSISTNGSSLPVRINQQLVQEGIVARYRSAIHPRNVYSTIKGLR